jgi:RHS repeat-associated protein
MARPFGLVQVDAAPQGTEAPTMMSIRLRNLDGTWVTFRGDLQEVFFRAGAGASRLAAQFEAGDRFTAAWAFDVVVRSWYADGTFQEAPAQRVRIPIINRKDSPYGAGWAVAGVQTLRDQGDGVFVVEGSTGLWFARGTCDGAGNCGYTSPDGDFTTMRWNAASAAWERRYPDGALVRFGGNGRMLSAADRFGNTTSFAHDANGRLLSVTDPLGAALTLGYDAAGKLATITDPGGRVSRFQVDAAGDLAGLWNPAGEKLLQAYYMEQHLLAYYYDQTGGMNSFYYDYGNFTVARVELPWVQADGGWVRPSIAQRSLEAAVLNATGVNGWYQSPAPYQGSDNVRVSATDPKGNVTYMAVDRFGSPTRIQKPLGHVTTIVRNTDGQPQEVTTPSGLVTRYTWEGGNLKTLEDVEMEQVTTFDYDLTLGLPRWVEQGGLRVNYRYGARGELLSTRVGSDSTTYGYTPDYRLASVTDPAGHRTELVYHPGGSRNTAYVREQDPNGEMRQENYEYDAFGRVASVSNGTNTTHSYYDVLNRDTATVDAAGRRTRATYRHGYLRTVIDAAGKVYRFNRNALGWVESEVDPNGRALQYRYDPAGNPIGMTNRRDQAISSTYDALGRIRTRTADGATTSYEYGPPDAFWASAVNGESADTVYFDRRGRTEGTVSRLAGLRFTRASEYSKEGARKRLAYTGPGLSRELFFGYDAARRLNRIQAPGGAGDTTRIAYDADGLPTSIRLPTGLTQTFTYTPTHQPSRARWSATTADNPLGRRYVHDHLGRQFSRANGLDDRMRRYDYDAVAQLTGWSNWRKVQGELICEDPMDPRSCNREMVWQMQDTATFAYDAVGNRAGEPLETTSNRYSSFRGFALEYDADGNLVRKSNSSSFDQRYAWNSLGQLTSVTTNGSTVTYGYNGLGQRVRRTDAAGTVTRQVYEGDDLLLETDGAGGVLREYVYYPGVDQPHSVRTPTGQTYYYALEEPGHVVGLVTGAGAVANQYAYTPFGETESATEAVEQPLRYMAREQDAATGLYYVRARWYDPQQGRFVSEDPIGLQGGINAYAYVDNSPTNIRDPSGLSPEPCAPGYQLKPARVLQPTGKYIIEMLCQNERGGFAFALAGVTTGGAGSGRSGWLGNTCIGCGGTSNPLLSFASGGGGGGSTSGPQPQNPIRFRTQDNRLRGCPKINLVVNGHGPVYLTGTNQIVDYYDVTYALTRGLVNRRFYYFGRPLTGQYIGLANAPRRGIVAWPATGNVDCATGEIWITAAPL